MRAGLALLGTVVLGAGPASAGEPVLVPGAGLTYTTMVATRQELRGQSALNLQVITTEARVAWSKGTEAKVMRTFTHLPDGSPLVNSENNYSIYHYFFVEEVSGEFRPGNSPANIRQVIKTVCDPAVLDSFFPLGHVEHVTVDCKQTVLRNGEEQPARDYTMMVSYEGRTTVTGPLGDTPAHRIRMSWAIGNTTTEGVIDFDDTRGLILDSDFTVSNGTFRNATHATITSVSP